MSPRSSKRLVQNRAYLKKGRELHAQRKTMTDLETFVKREEIPGAIEEAVECSTSTSAAVIPESNGSFARLIDVTKLKKEPYFQFSTSSENSDNKPSALIDKPESSNGGSTLKAVVMKQDIKRKLIAHRANLDTSVSQTPQLECNLCNKAMVKKSSYDHADYHLFQLSNKCRFECAVRDCYFRHYSRSCVTRHHESVHKQPHIEPVLLADSSVHHRYRKLYAICFGDLNEFLQKNGINGFESRPRFHDTNPTSSLAKSAAARTKKGVSKNKKSKKKVTTKKVNSARQAKAK